MKGNIMTTQMKKDIHLTGKDLMEMVQLRPEDVGKYAVVPGPKERLDGFLKCIENPITAPRIKFPVL